MFLQSIALHVDLQKKLLDPQNCDTKPDPRFLRSFADVVGSKWPSLASSLSLSGDEIANVKEEGLYPARLRPQDFEEVVGKRRCHIRSALPGTKNHPIVSTWQVATIIPFFSRVLNYHAFTISITLYHF